jgi:hypothetical protein
MNICLLCKIKRMKHFLMGFFGVLLLSGQVVWAQDQDSIRIEKRKIDSLYIENVENKRTPDKVLHAEPLFIDLIRDLGARKGEKEWNVGLGLTDNLKYDEYQALVEYEFAPIDRLGLEVELPFKLYDPVRGQNSPKSRLDGLKLAAQYTFIVSEKRQTSVALGYIHQFSTTSFSELRQEKLFEGNVFNPFLIAAKRWGQNIHTLIYTGPVHVREFTGNRLTSYEANSSFHYMIPGTRNFIGLEVNKSWQGNDFDMTLRPQMRVSIADNLLVGIVTGIPVRRENQRFSSFIRLIYEPGHKKGH